MCCATPRISIFVLIKGVGSYLMLEKEIANVCFSHEYVSNVKKICFVKLAY